MLTTEHTEIAENKNKFSLDELSGEVISAAMEVHRQLGPGLLELAYEACLVYELLQSGLRIERQKMLPVTYKDVSLDCGYRLDILVEGRLVVELKCVERLEQIHTAQVFRI